MTNFHLYHIEGLTDLQKARDEAQRRVKGNRLSPPQAGTIHMHRGESFQLRSMPGQVFQVMCNQQCERYEIEVKGDGTA